MCAMSARKTHPMDPEGRVNLRPKESVTVLLLLPPPSSDTHTILFSPERN